MTRWVILRTGGGQTLPLMRSLLEAKFDVWSPARPIRRTLKAKTPTGTRLIDTEVPILPTFVFASEADLPKLGDIADDLASGRGCLHPAFSIFRYGGRIPVVGDAESYAEAEKIRIAAMQTETARRRATNELQRAQRLALRSARRTFETGTAVEVADMPAMVGVAGVVEASDGIHAWVRFGSHSWKIEGWRVSPSDSDTLAVSGLAA